MAAGSSFARGRSTYISQFRHFPNSVAAFCPILHGMDSI